MENLTPYLDFALDALWQAGKITTRYFQTGIAVERKSDASPVTQADKEAEQLLRGLIAKSWPDHAIIGEEFGEQTTESDYTWLIDPIDGTKSFICGVPLYGCLLALTYQRQPVVGVMYFPALDEMIYAASGQGCFWNGRKAHVSSVERLEDAVLLASEAYRFKGREAQWARLAEATSIQRTWGDAYGYALVATGRAEIMVDAAMQVWDCGPLQVIMEEAGGTFTDWKGVPTIYNKESIATNGRLLTDVLGKLNENDN